MPVKSWDQPSATIRAAVPLLEVSELAETLGVSPRRKRRGPLPRRPATDKATSAVCHIADDDSPIPHRAPETHPVDGPVLLADARS